MSVLEGRSAFLFAEMERMPAVEGPCVACERKPARCGVVHVGAEATSQVGLCEACARLVERYERARNQRYAVAVLEARRLATVTP